MTTNFGGKLNLANWWIIAKYKFRQYFCHIIIIISSIYVAFLPLRRLLFDAPFPLCIKSEHATEIFRETCPITFALFLMATAYRSNALLLSCSQRPNVLIHVKATYTAFHHVRLHYFRTKWILWCKKWRIYRKHDMHMNCIAGKMERQFNKYTPN